MTMCFSNMDNDVLISNRYRIEAGEVEELVGSIVGW